MPSLHKNPLMTSVLIRLPVDLKKALQDSSKNETTTRYIIGAVEERLRREKLNSWVQDYLRSDAALSITPISREWPRKRFYHSKKK